MYDSIFKGAIIIINPKISIDKTNQNKIPDIIPKVSMVIINATIKNIVPIKFEDFLFDCNHFSMVKLRFNIAFFDVLYIKKLPKRINIILVVIIISYNTLALERLEN